MAASGDTCKPSDSAGTALVTSGYKNKLDTLSPQEDDWYTISGGTKLIISDHRSLEAALRSIAPAADIPPLSWAYNAVSGYAGWAGRAATTDPAGSPHTA